MSDSSEEEEQFVVGKILDRRIRNGEVQYLIKWQGYNNPEDNTWEPAKNCACNALITAYEKKHPQSKAPNASHEKVLSTNAKNPATKVVESKPDTDHEDSSSVSSTLNETAAEFTKGTYRAEIEKITKIVGCRKEGDNLWILCEFKHPDDIEPSPYDIIRKHAPRMLLDYWRERVETQK